MADTKNNMIADLTKVQGSLPNIKKDGKGNYGTYVTLDAIHEAVLPVLAKNNFAWVTLPGQDEEGNNKLDYKLIHESGESIEGTLKLLVSASNMQQLGSAITYARRYAISAVVGITADDDDDGEDAKKNAGTLKSKPYVEPVKDISADEAITDEALLKLTNAVKLKGIATLVKQKQVVNALASQYGVDNAADLTTDQGREVYVKIRDTDAMALSLLTEDE